MRCGTLFRVNRVLFLYFGNKKSFLPKRQETFGKTESNGNVKRD